MARLREGTGQVVVNLGPREKLADWLAEIDFGSEELSRALPCDQHEGRSKKRVRKLARHKPVEPQLR